MTRKFRRGWVLVYVIESGECGAIKHRNDARSGRGVSNIGSLEYCQLKKQIKRPKQLGQSEKITSPEAGTDSGRANPEAKEGGRGHIYQF